MIKRKVTITEDNGDINIFTDVSSITIVDDKIEIDYEDQNAAFLMDHTNEIVIKSTN